MGGDTGKRSSHHGSVGPGAATVTVGCARTSFTVSNKASLENGFNSHLDRTQIRQYCVPKKCPFEKGFITVATGWSHGIRSSSSAGNAADARMTGSVMCAERTFL